MIDILQKNSITDEYDLANSHSKINGKKHDLWLKISMKNFTLKRKKWASRKDDAFF